MKVLLGVTGGIAAYKAAELVRALQQRGVDVQVAMTSAAEEFVRPLTFAALSGHAVLGSLWRPEAAGEGEFAIEHIAIAQEIDALVIAPATANTLAKLAQGQADDLISTVYLATRAPVIVAPAMNVNMWDHAATQANVGVLEERGARVVAPDAGYLACGMTGGGRLAEVEAIAGAVMEALAPRHDLAGEMALVTAGGTREPIDGVRFLGNRSSGKMGHAIAEEAVSRGAHVVLVTASSLPAPRGCEVVRVATTREMRDAVMEHLADATLVVKAAAVADLRPVQAIAGKLRRGVGMTLEMEPTEDILAEVVTRRRPGTLVVGFAAEMEDVIANGRRKLERKGVDALVVNDVSSLEIGFDAEENAGWWLTPDGTEELTRGTKRDVARRILDGAARLRKRPAMAFG
jgi:phosphopantothenoylcysteine decarboxylase/phosphopantothenate--cysteine ligase